MFSRLALAALIGLASLPALAQAERPYPADLVAIETCLDTNGPGLDRQIVCIDVVSGPCLDQPGNDTTAGMNICLGRSIDAWDAILNEAYRAARVGLDDAQRSLLRDAQRAWITFRDKRCALEASYYRGGTLAGVVHGGCLEHETAIRAIDLRQIARGRP
ncbi:MAG: lysozyme inhibitor LprI family protein [Pseudomonadota bacterium]